MGVRHVQMGSTGPVSWHNGESAAVSDGAGAASRPASSRAAARRHSTNRRCAWLHALLEPSALLNRKTLGLAARRCQNQGRYRLHGLQPRGPRPGRRDVRPAGGAAPHAGCTPQARAKSSPSIDCGLAAAGTPWVRAACRACCRLAGLVVARRRQDPKGDKPLHVTRTLPCRQRHRHAPSTRTRPPSTTLYRPFSVTMKSMAMSCDCGRIVGIRDNSKATPIFKACGFIAASVRSK